MMDEFIGKLIADKYRIESLIRESDSGDLYIGRHDIRNQAATIRILPQALAMDARWAKRFLDEARLASALNHENILNINDFGTDSRSIVYAIYEPVSGNTLKSLAIGDAAFDQSRAINIARQIANAAVAAHSQKAIHGSLSPATIFVSDDASDSVKVLGFGADKMTVARDADGQYLAPEQRTNFPVADERSDVYSLGVILYKMLTGEIPFTANISTDLPPMSAFRQDLNPQIEPILRSATAGEADNRYQTMADFAEDLERVSGEIGGKPLAAAAAAGTNIWQTAFIVLAGIMLLGGALIWFTLGKKTDPATAALVGDANSLPVQPINPATGIQEDTMVKMVGDFDASIMQNANGMLTPPGTLAGGDDGLNPWANGGAPPIGAPPPTFVAPGGQTVTIDPNSPSQFMPNDPGTIILVPIPANNDTAVQPEPPTKPAGNTAVQPTPAPTPKQMATPPPKSPAQPKGKPADKKPAAGIAKPPE